MTWLTPSQLDLEHWRWLRMKPQRGGWVRIPLDRPSRAMAAGGDLYIVATGRSESPRSRAPWTAPCVSRGIPSVPSVSHGTEGSDANRKEWPDERTREPIAD
jgi:hypothetical protein